MSMNSYKNIIVVGGNAAGPAAAAKAKRNSPDSNVILFETGNFISTGTCELPYVLSGEIKDWKQIVFYTPETFENEKGVKVFNNHLVEFIDRKYKTILVKNLISNHKLEYVYDKLILCTGSTAKKITTLPSNLTNVFQLKSVADIIKIKEYLNNNVSSALIIGAGYIGLETADALSSIGIHTTIFDKENLPMYGIEDETCNLVYDILKKNKIDFYGNVKDPVFYYEDNKFKSVNIDGWRKEFDITIICIGHEPNVSLAVSAKLELGETGAIKVNKLLQTSDPNIYAAGDCIEVSNHITNKPTYLPLATFAHQFGHIAGENSVGGFANAPKIVRNIAVKLFDKNLVVVGMCKEGLKKRGIQYSSVSSIVPNLIKVMPASNQVFGKILFEKSTQRLLGANFLGGKEVIGYGDLISTMIKNNIKATELTNINFNYTPPLSPFINLLSILGRKIQKGK